MIYFQNGMLHRKFKLQILRLEGVVGYSIMSGQDILRADKDCRQKKGMGIADWVQNWMQKETREELLVNG